MPFALIFAVSGFVMIGAGVWLLRRARSDDLRNYVLQRVTPMPLSLVNERDDVWLRGVAECVEPVVAPHFGIDCLVCHYRFEKRERGESGDYWDTMRSSDGEALFRLREGGETIEIEGRHVKFEGLLSRRKRVASFRHSMEYIPCGHEVSAVGSVSVTTVRRPRRLPSPPDGPAAGRAGEGQSNGPVSRGVSERRRKLESYRNIPLLVTRQERGEYVREAERREAEGRRGGFAAIWLGTALVTACVPLIFIGLRVLDVEAFWPSLYAAPAVATAVVILVWMLYAHNTLVAYRVRAENAWRQVDVDLEMRCELIPKLVAAVKAYLVHEKDVLERLTALRGEALSGGRDGRVRVEGRLAGALVEMKVAVERYPELASQPVVAGLMREVTALEEKIAHGRSVYNEAAREYNEHVRSFPELLIARAFGFRTRAFFRDATRQ